MGARRLTATLAVLAAAAMAAAATGCGGSSSGDGEAQAKQQSDRYQANRQAAIKKAVKDGRLPPVTLDMLMPDGEINISFIDGPKGDKDVVHTHGTSGPPLKWDLDGDGKISAAERTITERELYDATLGLR
jgi:hypothetical protein